jgi:hypothetical protein
MSNNNLYKQNLCQLEEHLEPEVINQIMSVFPEGMNQNHYKGMYNAFHFLAQYVLNGEKVEALSTLVMGFLVVSQRHIKD